MAGTAQSALSTVAMTAYNALAVARAPVVAEEVESVAARLHAHPEQVERVHEGLAALVQRGLAREDDGGRFSLVDPLCRPVVARARTGEGWDGWLVRDRSGAQLPIAAVTSGRPDMVTP